MDKSMEKEIEQFHLKNERNEKRTLMKGAFFKTSIYDRRLVFFKPFNINAKINVTFIKSSLIEFKKYSK